jgi:ribosomal protein S27E
MSPIFMWTIAETVARTTLEKLTRWCPKCGRRQVVPKEKLMSEVKCESCGASVLAPEFNRRRS